MLSKIEETIPVYYLRVNSESFFSKKSRWYSPLKSKKTVKDLGVWTGEDASFEEHIEYHVQASKIRTGMLLRVFKTRSLNLL